MEKIRRPRGTADITAPEISAWRKIEDTARAVAGNFGYTEIRTPTFEELGLFSRGVGETTDVVQKEMYAFEDREGRRFALRPEGTAGVVRAVIENGKCSDTMPLRLFYIINCFRYEKPQAGRSREFYQFGTEMFGAPDAAADFTVISLADTFIKKLGIKNTALHINSIGCPECGRNTGKSSSHISAQTSPSFAIPAAHVSKRIRSAFSTARTKAAAALRRARENGR